MVHCVPYSSASPPCGVRVCLLVNHQHLSVLPPGQWATLRTTTVCLLQEATECCPTETPQPASPRPPLAWSASPPWGRLESHQGPSYATNPHLTGLCVFFCFPTSPLSLLWSWLNMSDMTHNATLHFVCSSRIISVLKTRLNSVVWSGLQLDVYEHTVSQKDLLCGWLFLTVWRLITSRPTRKMCFYSTAIRMQSGKWNPPLLSRIKTVLGLS